MRRQSLGMFSLLSLGYMATSREAEIELSEQDNINLDLHCLEFRIVITRGFINV